MDADLKETVKRMTLNELNQAIRAINSTIDFTNGESYDMRAAEVVKILEELREEVKNRTWCEAS